MNSFLLLCECLSLDDRSAAAHRLDEALATPDVAQAIVRTADDEMLAPALWMALRRRDLADILPEDIRGSLQRRYQMNALLNERIRDEAEHVSEVCGRAGTIPVALKGGAFLYEVDPQNLGVRAMRDLDFLIPEPALGSVAEAMLSDGYRIKEGEDENWTYAYPALERPGGIVAIELHQYVGQQRSLLPADLAWEGVRPLESSGGSVQCLSPTHRVWHNVFHSQIQDRGQLFGFIWLRQLVDLADICTRHAEDIDWHELERLFDQQGLGRVLFLRLYQAQQLLGLRWPLSLPPGVREKILHQRSVFLIRVRWAMWLTRLAAGVTAPLKKYHLDLLYGCGTNNFWRLFLCRIRHACKIARSHRGAIFQRVWDRREYDV